MIRFVCALAIVVGFVSPALADIPPPPPEKGLKRVPLEHLVKVSKDVSGYKFYSFQRLGINGTPTVEELKLGTEKGIAVAGSSSGSVWTGVIAVPDKLASELKTENIVKLLTREGEKNPQAGVMIHSTGGESRDLKESDPRSKVENVITISADDKMGVKFTTAETPAAPSKKSSSDAAPPSSTMIAGIAMAGALMTGGLWFWRKKETA